MPGNNSIRTLLEARYGTRFTPVVTSPAAGVGTGVSTVLRSNPSRIGFLLVNLSLNNIFVSPNNSLTTTNGIRLDANGGNLETLWYDDGEVVANEWFAVADGAASALFVLESVIDAGG